MVPRSRSNLSKHQKRIIFDHKNLLIIDDLLATGGTVIAALDLIKNFGDKNIVGAGFVINLPNLGGEEKMRQLGIKTKYLIEF